MGVDRFGIFGSDGEELRGGVQSDESLEITNEVARKEEGLTEASKAAKSPFRKWAPRKEIWSYGSASSHSSLEMSTSTYAALTVTAGMIVAVDVEAILGKLGPLGLASLEDSPEFLGRGSVTREAKADADDGYVVHLGHAGKRG